MLVSNPRYIVAIIFSLRDFVSEKMLKNTASRLHYQAATFFAML